MYRFSLIIPTINRVDTLFLLFDSLANQTFKNFEIILVDQNKDDRLLDLVSTYTNQFKINHIKTNITGASAARNQGLKKFNGEIITFPDDDCEYPSALLENINIFLKSHEYFDGVSVTTFDKNNQGKIFRSKKKKNNNNKV